MIYKTFLNFLYYSCHQATTKACTTAANENHHLRTTIKSRLQRKTFEYNVWNDGVGHRQIFSDCLSNYIFFLPPYVLDDLWQAGERRFRRRRSSLPRSRFIKAMPVNLSVLCAMLFTNDIGKKKIFLF